MTTGTRAGTRAGTRGKLWGVLCLAVLLAIALFAFGWTEGGHRRPQAPAGPLPYEVRHVIYHNPDDGLRLSGTLTLPRGAGPHPAVVLVPGAGEVDRDGSLFGHQFYLVLADNLTRRGIAVLRSDKRGLGQSEGDFAGATSLDFASDIAAGVAFMRTRPEIDGRRIGLVGHSEGGLVGSLVAGRDPGIAFLVLMAGNGIPAGDMLLAQTRHRLSSAEPDRVERELALQRAVFAAVSAPGGAREHRTAVRELYLAAQRRDGRPFSEDEAAPYLTPWMATLLRLDPQPLLRRLRCPVLALVGDRDQVVRADENVPALRRALAGNPDAQVHRLPGLNHFFQHARSGALAEVAGIEETMSPRALDLIGEWVLRHAGR